MTVMSITGPAGVLHVDDFGADGLPVVFLHSYAGSARHWASQMAHLRSSRRVVAFDLRGHGASAPPPDDDYSVDALAEDLEAVVDSLDLQRFVLVGHSLGASVAVAYAAAHPGQVAGVLVVGLPGKLPGEMAQKVIAAVEDDYDHAMDEHWNKLLEGATPEVQTQIGGEKASIPKDASIQLIKATVFDDPVTPLRRYSGPVLVVSTPHSDMPHDVHRLMPHLPHEVITGTSHWPQLDKPEEFNELLDDFLAGIE